MKKTKILGLILAFAVMISQISFTGFAADSTETEVSTYESLIAALANGENVKMTADIIAPDKAVLNISNQTLDLGTKTLTINGESGSIANSTIKNGTIEITTYEGDTVADGVFDVNGDSTVMGVTFHSDKFAIYALFDLKAGNLTVDNCVIDMSNNTIGGNGGLFFTNGGDTLTIKNTTVTGTDVGDFICNGTAVLKDCNVTLKGTVKDGLDNGINGTALTLNNTNLAVDGATGRGITTDGNNITINGTSVVALTNCAEGGIRFKKSAEIIVADTASLSGTVKVDSAATDAKVNGTVVAATSTDLPTLTVENGSVEVKEYVYPAKVGATGYKSIEEALKVVKTGETVYVSAGTYTMATTSFTLPDNVSIVGEGDVTLNNKLSFTAKGLLVKNIDILIASGNALQISGNGTFEDCNITGGNGVRSSYANDGTVEFKNCVVTGNTYGIHFDAGNGKVVIDGCTITGWTSFGSALESVTIKNSKFEEGAYNVLRFYQDATVTKTEFNPKTRIDSGSGGAGYEGIEISFENCTVSDGSDFADRIATGILDKSDVYVDGKVMEAPTTISTVEDLQAFAESVNNGNTYKGKTVVLANDIDLMDGEGIIADMSPIGSKENPFKGTFDGKGYVIDNLYLGGYEDDGETFADSYVGLFGYIDSPAVVKNVTVNNPFIVGKDCVGGIVGCAYTGKVENCHVTGEIDIEGYYKVGGITGYGYAAINNCSVIGAEGWDYNTISAVYHKADLEGDNVGGIIGHFGEGPKTMENCRVENVNITGTRKIGGIVGTAFKNHTYKNCTVSNVTIGTNATAEYASSNADSMGLGGIIGIYANTYLGGAVEDCSISGITFTNENNVTVSTGAITGGWRNGGELKNPAIVATGNSVTDVTGVTNEYLKNIMVTLSADGGKYADGTSAVAFNASYEQWSDTEVASFGMYIFKQSDNMGTRITVDTEDGKDLKAANGLFNVVVTEIPEDAANDIIVCLPYVIINNEVIPGNYMAVSASQFLKNLVD